MRFSRIFKNKQISQDEMKAVNDGNTLRNDVVNCKIFLENFLSKSNEAKSNPNKGGSYRVRQF
jgi:hypothetical protein